MTNSASDLGSLGALSRKVAAQYNAYPYPYYPAWLGLRWQEGYVATSEFAGRLLWDCTGTIPSILRSHDSLEAQSRTVLLAGSGDTMPYIMRKLEPASHRLLCVDLSEKSIKRARIRCLRSFGKINFYRKDIDQFLQRQGIVTGPYDHIDLYGVAHHLANPTETLANLSARLGRHGTIRIMVYNSKARRWIHELQHAFKALQLKFDDPQDIVEARKLLYLLARHSPNVAKKTSQIGRKAIDNDHRFVDTFLHSREARLSLREWLNATHNAGLKIYGLYDRYAELDDLPNPLWNPPSEQQLESRIASGSFENNFEWYMSDQRPQILDPQTLKQESAIQVIPKYRLWSRLVHMPIRVRSYSETSAIPKSILRKIWWAHLLHTNGNTTVIDDLIQKIPLESSQRLARIGVIMPCQVVSSAVRNALMAPMSKQIDSPQIAPAEKLRGTPVAEAVLAVMQKKKNYDESRFSLVMERIYRAQK